MFKHVIIYFIFIGLLFIISTSALWVVISPNLVHSAVSLLFTLFGVAGLYVFLYADFLAATQVVIYVGGILVLIIFGVMLTNKIDKPIIESNSLNKTIGLTIENPSLLNIFNLRANRKNSAFKLLMKKFVKKLIPRV